MKSRMGTLPWVLGVAVLLIAIGTVMLMILNKPAIDSQLSDISTEPPVADPVRQELQEGVTSDSDWSVTVSSLLGVPLQLELAPMQEGAVVTFEVEVGKGSFLQEPANPRENPWKQAVLYDHFSAENGRIFYWNPRDYWFDENDKVNSSEDDCDYTYVDMIVREDDNIVGFAVAKIFAVELGYSYKAEIVKIVRYPMVNGKYQNVAMATVRQDIAEAKRACEQAA